MRDVNAAAVQRVLPHGVRGLRLERARGDLDAELVSAAGRTILSGPARLEPLVARVATASVSPLRGDEVTGTVDPELQPHQAASAGGQVEPTPPRSWSGPRSADCAS